MFMRTTEIRGTAMKLFCIFALINVNGTLKPYYVQMHSTLKNAYIKTFVEKLHKELSELHMETGQLSEIIANCADN
jgi:hypothetical protein